MGATLFAWAAPALLPGAPLDHTWVTTYDLRAESLDDEAGTVGAQHYWFCWGDRHSIGASRGRKTCNIRMAKCLVEPDHDCRSSDAARGTIFVYGFDGVCHQLANQVLFSTHGVDSLPLKVTGAAGYVASVYVYGEYGNREVHWFSKLNACFSGTDFPKPSSPGAVPGHAHSLDRPNSEETTMSTYPDELEKQARIVLQDSPEKLAKFLTLTIHVRNDARIKQIGAVPPDPDWLNRRDQEYFAEAAKLLGQTDFQRIFGFASEQPVFLVDPKFAAHGLLKR